MTGEERTDATTPIQGSDDGADIPTDVEPPLRFGVPDDPEATEQLRTQLIAITEAERKALNDAGHFIAASSDLPGVQGLASVVCTVANRGGVNAR